MKTTKDGRPLCQVRDLVGGGPVLYFDPKLYSVLKTVSEQNLPCTLELNFTNTGLGSTHIRMDGERLSKALDSGSSTTAILQPMRVS